MAIYLVEDVSGIAYEKAVEIVTGTVRAETQKEDIGMILEYKSWLLEPERKAPKDKREYAAKRLDTVIEKITSAAQKATTAFRQNLMEPEIRKAGTEQVREKARESVLERLARGKVEADRKNRERWEHQERIEPAGKRDMEI